MSTIVFPSGGRQIVDQMCAKFPELHVNDDEKQRELTTRIQQQFVHDYGPRWGGKKRTGLGDEYKSKDSMAYKESHGCSTWDMFQGDAEATILVNDGDAPDHPDLPPEEATFMEVEGRNWLELPDIDPPDFPDDDEIEEKLDQIIEMIERLSEIENRNTAAIIANGDFNTQRVMDELHRIVEEFEATAKKVLAVWLAQRESPDSPPEIDGEPPSQLVMLLLKILADRPAKKGKK